MTSVAALAGIPASTGTKNMLNQISDIELEYYISRTAEDLLSLAGLMGDQKKARFDSVPSKVIHVRNVPYDATDTEDHKPFFKELISETFVFQLLALGLPFGRVKNVLLLKAKKPHEPTQMEDKQTAATFLSYYTQAAPAIRGQVVYVQYSNHPELKTEPSQHSVGTSKIIAAAQSDFPTSPYASDGQQAAAAVAAALSKGAGKSLGNILRIVTFTKNAQFQALIEFSSTTEAELAKVTLDGQNIYNGCCTLHLEYSKLTTLTVKFNNEKSKMNQIAFRSICLLFHTGYSGTAGSGAGLMGAPALLGLLPQGGLLQANFLAAASGRSPVGPIGAITHLSGVKVYGKEIKVTASKHNSVSMPKEGDENNLTKDFTSSPLHRFKKPGSKNFQNIFPPSRTLHLSNIPESTSEDELVDAFTETGTVTEKDRKMALVTMASTEEAIDALVKMHNYKITESNHLRVSFAKTRTSS
ncbi:Polypyrimidine tract-binding protein 1 [Acropora cervicornis]|uniref:Polypyrimidine tract-binding protein 1 n=1 Tax=Acropora cervicornis TaxID=6130 RepID=A0AAD9Q4I5_ACRCE|nr:Polypyrimidine tract-binding protein 1 [Acropora cervicornis]